MGSPLSLLPLPGYSMKHPTWCVCSRYLTESSCLQDFASGMTLVALGQKDFALHLMRNKYCDLCSFKAASPHLHRVAAGRDLNTVGDSTLNVWALSRPKGYLFPPGLHLSRPWIRNLLCTPLITFFPFYGYQKSLPSLVLGRGQKKHLGCSSKVKVHT